MIVNKEWQSLKVNKISPKKLEKLLKEQEFYILDVRPRNFIQNASFIKGVHFCPLVHLAKCYVKIPKDKPIIITDWAMRQSIIAAKFLLDKDYPIFGVLKGGIERWKEENLPVEERENPFFNRGHGISHRNKRLARISLKDRRANPISAVRRGKRA